MAESTRCCGVSLGRAAYTLAVLSAVFYGVGIITMITVVSHEGSINKALDDVAGEDIMTQSTLSLIELQKKIGCVQESQDVQSEVLKDLVDSFLNKTDVVNRMKTIADVNNQTSVADLLVEFRSMMSDDAGVNETNGTLAALESRDVIPAKKEDVTEGYFDAKKINDSAKALCEAVEDVKMTDGNRIVARNVAQYRPWLTALRVSLLVESLLMFVMSLLLIYGLRQRLHAYMLPYLVTYFIGFWVIWVLLKRLLVAVFVAHIGYGFLALFLFLVIHFVKAVWWFAIRCEFENIKKSTKVTLSNR